MDENMPIRVDKQEISLQSQSSFFVTKGKRRKRKGKRLVGRLFAIIILGVCIYFFVTKFTVIKNFVANTFEQFNIVDKDEPSTPNENEENDSTNENTKDESNDSISGFIDTCPDKFQFVNELNTEIIIDEAYSFSKAKELYEKYSYDAPIVLIVNFSPTEAYCDGDSFYSNEKNVCSIGKEICDRLNKNGINSLHLFDTSSPSLYESKAIYEQKITDTLKMYPSISYIFDISRAIHIDESLNIENEYVTVDSNKLPTIQLLCGTSNGDLTVEQKKSIFLANELSKTVNKNEIPLISKIIIAKYNLSQKFPCNTLRVDIGSYACKYEDALLTAYTFTDSIIDFLNN